jgi:hypothetical protein
LSALGLTITGKYTDRITLKDYALTVFSGLILAMIFLSQTRSLWSFVSALFMLRFFGQSLMTHTATTGIAKYFGKTRGKALGISNAFGPKISINELSLNINDQKVKIEDLQLISELGKTNDHKTVYLRGYLIQILNKNHDLKKRNSIHLEAQKHNPYIEQGEAYYDFIISS